MKEQMERNMDIVFEHAKVKALIRNSKPGNTSAPWLDFTIEHLSMRLDEEFLEWKESNNSQELLDIINLAAFVWLSKSNNNIKDMIASSE